MTIIRPGLVLLLVLSFLTCNTVIAQSVDEKAEPSRSGVRVTSEHEKKENFPIHVTDILLERPEAQEALRSFRERKERAERGFKVQTYETTQAEVGDEEMFKVNNFETDSYDDIEFELMAVGDVSEIWVEIDEWGPGKITQEVIDNMMKVLEEETPERSIDPDRGIIELDQELFGEPPNVDGSGKVKVFLTNIQDGWDPEEGGGFIAGFFDPLDLSETDPNSNSADIIYINTFPGIYTDELPANPQNSLNTIAHEYQHLIHARYGNLNIFQNEGQSELAEILTGFNARPMVFLNDPEEVSGDGSTAGLYRWRTDDADEVLWDYERAGLLHSYLSERVGPFQAGKLTQADNAGRRGYESVLTDEGITWEDFLADFYVANWVNDRSIEERYGYDLPQLRGVQASNPAISFNSATSPSWVINEEATIGYGGAHYTNWFGVENLNLDINDTEGIRHYIASRERGDPSYTVTPVNGTEEFNGIYESITLISVNTTPRSGETGPGTRSFTFGADWDRTNLAIKEYKYYSDDEVPFYVELFADEDATKYSVRLTPEEPGNISNLHFDINNRPEAIEGEGTLKITLTESDTVGGSGADEARIPAEAIASKNIPFSNLAPGTNVTTVDAFTWEVDNEREYHITYEIIDGSEGSKLEFLVDHGSIDESNDIYYPARTLVFVEDLSMGGRWSFFEDNSNLYTDINLIYEDGSLSDIDDSDPPYTDAFDLEQNYPNPFSSRTVIRYNLVDEVPVRLEVYDVLGRKVQTLVDESNQEPGSYEIPFDGTGLSSGIYLYRLRAGNYIQTAKMIFAR
ncbi:MAG: T9SS type A sorting domain-containing protein [Balneolales bacterium]